MEIVSGTEWGSQVVQNWGLVEWNGNLSERELKPNGLEQGP